MRLSDGPSEGAAGRILLRIVPALLLACAPGDGVTPAAGPPAGPGPGTPAPTPPVAGAVFPLHVEGGKRYLIDASGAPFLLHGDSPWSLIVQLTREDVDRYLDDRRARGFNTLLVNLLEHKFSDHPPRNAYGEEPFLVAGDFGKPNEAYFAHADWVIRRAGEKGFLVLLVPAYLGYGGGDQGWYQEILSNGAAKLREYGRYVGRRYASFPNVLWTMGGDYDPPQRWTVREVAAGIRDVDSTKLLTAHCAPETAALDYWGGDDWLDVNNLYTYGDVYEMAAANYARSVMPYFLLESTYENEHGATPAQLRRQAWHAVLTGAAGQVFGNAPIWSFGAPGIQPGITITWQQALDSPGARSMTYLRALLAARPWWALEPDIGHTLLVGGAGTGAERAVAARTADGRLALVYAPTRRVLVLDPARVAGASIAARWYDPSAGTFLAAPATGAMTSRGWEFTMPGANASGADDWVLVLEAST